jgi:hypothetical protein
MLVGAGGENIIIITTLRCEKDFDLRQAPISFSQNLGLGWTKTGLASSPRSGV